MNFIQKIFQQIEYGDYEPVIKYGQIHAEKINKTDYTLSPQLLRGKTDWVLRLDLNERISGSNTRKIIDLHFQTLDQIRAPFQQLLRDVDAGVTQSNFTQKTTMFEKAILNAASGKLIRSYGRIDHHPKNDNRFKVELYLSWDGQRYWMVLREGEGSIEWSKWSLGTVEAIDRLFPRIEATAVKSKHP